MQSRNLSHRRDLSGPVVLITFFACLLPAAILPGAILAEQEPKPSLTEEAKPAQKPAAKPDIPTTISGVEMDQEKNGLKIKRTREDFSSLSLVGSDLALQEPILGAHEENQDFVRDLYQVQWRANDPIDLYIIRPAGVKKPPVVLYLYGFPTDTDRFRNPDYCRRVTHNGVAAVGFVSALTGQRFAGRPMKQWFVSEMQESLATTVHDVQMILNLLEKRDDLDLSRVGIFGQGSGGAIAILAASVDARIKALDLLAPWGDWPDWLAQSTVVPPAERPDYLKPEFLKKLEPLEPVKYLPGLKDRRLRIQFLDEPPPMASTKRLEDAAPANAKIIHFATSKELSTAISGGRLFQWLSDQLHPAVQTQSPALAQPAGTTGKGGSN